MAIVVSAQDLEAGFGARPLFSGVNFTIEEGERIGLIGPNGAGKSTLLRILAGAASPDSGQISRRRGLRIGHLAQVPHLTPGATVEQIVHEGIASDDWDRLGEAQAVMAKLSLGGRGSGAGISPTTVVDSLSGGWKKRVALARELSRHPDLLLLDEPTNHLDVASIEWIEALLAAAPFATVTVTHDRLFLQRVATRILELDRRNAGGLLSVAGDYTDYLRVKEETMHAQERREVVLRNTLRRETEWLRRGAAARSTKQQARIQRAGTLASDVAELTTRNQQRAVALDFEAQQRRPKRLIEARGISKNYGGRTIFRGVDALLGPGVRLGLLGANGCGKSTLIRVLLGEEPPQRRKGRRAPMASRWRTSHRTATRSTPTAASPTPSARMATSCSTAGRACTCAATWNGSSSPRSRSTWRSASSRAASRAASCWRSSCCGRRSSWCSTSRPTISTWRRSRCSRNR